MEQKTMKLFLLVLFTICNWVNSHADNITTTPIQDGSDITEGYYIIRLNGKLQGGEQHNYITAKDGYTKWIKKSNIDETLIWKLTKNNQGGFSMKHIATQCYVGKTTKAATATNVGKSFAMVTTNDENSISFGYLGKSTATENKDECQYKIVSKDGPQRLHCESYKNQEGFIVPWGGDLNSASGWCFERIEKSIGDQLDEKYQQATCIITIKKVDEKGTIIESYSQSVKKGENYIFKPEIKFYTHISTTVDGKITEEASFTTNQSAHVIIYSYNWNMPFETTRISGNSFPSSTKWYLLTLSGNYVTYNKKTPDILSTTKDKSFEDGYWWAFSGDYKNGIKVYNKAAGATKVMTSLPPTQGDTHVYMDEIGNLEASQNITWSISTSRSYPTENGFYLKRNGEDTKIHWKNEQVILPKEQSTGATFRVQACSEEALALKEKYENQTGNQVGALNETSLTILKGMKTETPEDIQAILTFLENADVNQLDPNKFYILRNTQYTKSYLGLTDNGILLNEHNNDKANVLVRFESNNQENTYYLRMQNAYVGNIRKTSEKIGLEGTSIVIDNKDTYTFKKGLYSLENRNGTEFSFRNMNTESDNLNYSYLHLASLPSGGYGIVAWENKPNASWWYIEEVTTYNFRIGETGYATACMPFAFNLPENSNLKAYTGTTLDNNKITLQEVKGTIPAGTAVILIGSPGNYNLVLTADVPEIPSSLSGTYLPETLDASLPAYILAKPEGHEIGFYRLNQSERTIGSNKAYLIAPNNTSSIKFQFGSTTQIGDIKKSESTEEYYDLKGRRTLNPKKGIYITKTGKKILFF